LSVAILGAPNVGKSTLLNQLAGYEAAIVSPIAGTTRDLVREHIQLDGLTLHLVDTAGLRSTEDMVEAEGIRRGLAAAERAELILYVADSTEGLTEFDTQQLCLLRDRPVLLLLNKCDLAPTEAIEARLPDGIRQVLPMSAKSGAGIAALVAALKAQAGIAELGEGAFLARARHIEGLNQALGHLETAQGRLAEQALPELAAEELRLAQLALGRITGDFGSEELLGAIFSRFCIGK
jgi:tRNA modification GTPase